MERPFAAGSSTLLLVMSLVAAACPTKSFAQSTPATSLPSGSDQGGATLTVNDAVFTEEQAERGRLTYNAQCSNCHRSDQLGNWDYLKILRGAPVWFFYDRIASTMPENAANTLSSGQYTDIVSFLLRQAGYPTGSVELPANEDAMRKIILMAPTPR